MFQTVDHQPDLEQKLLKVTKMIAEARIRSDERAKATHERFNIFTTLLSESDEVRLHTRFLHCLLDPKGCHDCGSLFLGLFLTMLNELPGVDDSGKTDSFEIPQSGAQWSIRKEVSCPPHGQIDILLDRPGFKIAIENKINAAEQHRQLACYSEFLRKHSKDKTLLIYLTKDGKKSEEHGGAPYVRISYANHILPWLEKCLRETYQMVPINQGILQYREVVRQITGKTLQLTTMKPIAEFVAKNPDIIRYRKQIMEATNVACANFFDGLADGIQEGFQGEFQVRQHEKRKFGADNYGALILKTEKFPFEIYIEHDSSRNIVAIGVSGPFDKTPPSNELSNLFQKMGELLRADAEAIGYDKPTVTTNWPCGWHNLIEGINDGSLADLMQTPLHETVTEVCGKIRNYLISLESIYAKAKSASTP